MTDEQATAVAQYAFRCNNCNTLIEAGHAGERTLPAKCPTCGKGVRFSEDGIKTYDDSNWTVLADLDGPDLDGVLEYHVITPDQIVAHTPAEAPEGAEAHEPQSIEVFGEGSEAGAGDTTGAQA